jgi:hypothetical protein
MSVWIELDDGSLLNLAHVAEVQMGMTPSGTPIVTFFPVWLDMNVEISRRTESYATAEEARARLAELKALLIADRPSQPRKIIRRS